MITKKKVAVVGGGAAGFFAALQCKKQAPDVPVTIFEKSPQVLGKVKISGGGRCNLTHHCFEARELIKYYPRGGRDLRGVLHRFGPSDLIHWFEDRGVELQTQEDGRMFPRTNRSQTIVDCLCQEAQKAGVAVLTGREVVKINLHQGGGFTLEFSDGSREEWDFLLITTGGCSRMRGFQWLQDLGHTIEPPVPSLFTFNIPHPPLRELMGLSVPLGEVKIPGIKRVERGPLLITHWGLSGPGVLKFSAWEARELSHRKYNFPLQVNWLGISSEEEVRKALLKGREAFSSRQISSLHPFTLSKRLWMYFLDRCQILPTQKWAELSKKNLNRLIETLLRDPYEVSGKTTFKDEFVTCGGVVRREVDFKTMESKVVPGLYFAGEVMDIDGITGGFNLQAAWSTGWLAGDSIGKSL